MPALPAFVLLAAAVPLLVPTFVGRMGRGSHPIPGRRPGLRARSVVGFLARRPSRRPPARVPVHVHAESGRAGYLAGELIVDEIGVPVDADVVSLDVRRAVTPTCSRGRTRPRVPAPSTACTGARRSRGFTDDGLRGSRRATAATFAPRRSSPRASTRFVDRDPPADAIYRIGVAANWLDDETSGDVFAISPPVAPPASSG